jgi:hypothetical protein
MKILEYYNNDPHTYAMIKYNLEIYTHLWQMIALALKGKEKL